MPQGYGADDAVEFVSWMDVQARLRESQHYWISTTRSDGRPHVVPRWGVWLEDRFWYDGSPHTLHARNADANPSCVLHLEDGERAVILEGRSERSQPLHGDLAVRIADEIARKYAPAYRPGPDSWGDEQAGGMRVVWPHKILAWTEFPKDLTRFTF